MKTALEKINEITSKEVSPWLKKAQEREKDRGWTDRSSKIAIRILREIRKQKPINGMTQKRLAEEMGVTPQYISKVVKGKENLTLETIAKIEEVLGVKLVEVPMSVAIIKNKVTAVKRAGATSIIEKQVSVDYTEEAFVSDFNCIYG